MSGRGCADADPEDFYPETRGSGKSAREAQAKEICAGCDVRLKCLEWALLWDAATAGESWGIHGGMNGQERDQLRRQRVGGAA
jgi:WhiB family redox-sensing transcriptional regulator